MSGLRPFGSGAAEAFGRAGLTRPGDATRLRIAAMSSTCRTALEFAAVIGKEFDLDVLAESLSVDRNRIADDLRPALDAGILHSSTPIRLRFAHGVVRESLYRAVGPGIAVRIHRRVAEALEALHGSDPMRAAEIAHHFRQIALAGGDPAKAALYSEAAARTAAAMNAHEEAAEQLQRGLEALGGAGPGIGKGGDAWRSRLADALSRLREAIQHGGGRGIA